MDRTTHIIPAGYAYSFVAKLSKAALNSTSYTDITDPSEIPATDWALCFVNTSGSALLTIPLDWSQMSNEGHIIVTLSAEQTLALSGKRLHLEVRNSATTSDLTDSPEDYFYFVPNNMHN